MRASRKFMSLSLVLISILVAFCLGEVLLRSFYPVGYMAPPVRSEEDEWRKFLHRRSAKEGLSYELSPSREVFVNNMNVVTNSLGMRDSEPVSGDMFRIAVIGASFTFGFGVDNEETYPAVLESLLNTDDAQEGPGFDVLNMGVGGYGAEDFSVVIREKVPDIHPSLVIYSYSLNDPETDPVQPLHRYYREVRWWQHSHVLRLIMQAKRDWQISRYGQGDYNRYLHRHPDKWESVERLLQTLKETSDANGFEVLVVVFPMTQAAGWDSYQYDDLHRQVADAATRHGLETFDLLDTFRGFEPDRIMLAPNDSHPNRLGHLIAARAIHEYLLQNGRLPVLESRQ